LNKKNRLVIRPELSDLSLGLYDRINQKPKREKEAIE